MGLNRYLPPMPPLERLEGWESRLDRVVEAARRAPYKLGEHDCFRFATNVVAALTGHDHWEYLAGRYRDRMSAARLIVDHGPSFRECFSYAFGVSPSPVYDARRGDICMFEDVEPHLGACVGSRVAVLKDDGLAFVPVASCSCAWRIG